MGVVWGDYDGDGWPDLIVTNDSAWNYLYHNKQNGTFEDLGVVTGLGLGPFGEPYGNMAADLSDFDRDGKFDILVSRFGSQPASLYCSEAPSEWSLVRWLGQHAHPAPCSCWDCIADKGPPIGRAAQKLRSRCDCYPDFRFRSAKISGLGPRGGFYIEQIDAGYLSPFPKSGSYCWWGTAVREQRN